MPFLVSQETIFLAHKLLGDHLLKHPWGKLDQAEMKFSSKKGVSRYHLVVYLSSRTIRSRYWTASDL